MRTHLLHPTMLHITCARSGGAVGSARLAVARAANLGRPGHSAASARRRSRTGVALSRMLGRRVKRALARSKFAAPIVGAALGGLAGAALGGVFGLGGGAVGGAAGYLIQKVSDRIGNAHILADALLPRMIGSIPSDTTDFVGREEELRSMSEFLDEKEAGVCLLVGFGGCGKSATLKEFATREDLFRAKASRDRHATFSWSFAEDPSLERFFYEFRSYLDPLLRDGASSRTESQSETYLELPDLILRSAIKVLLILDAIEIVTVTDSDRAARDGSLAVPALRVLLQRANEGSAGDLRIVCTSRVAPPELVPTPERSTVLDMNVLPTSDGVKLLRRLGCKGRRAQLVTLVERLRNHAYSLSLMGRALETAYRGDARQADAVLGTTREVSNPLYGILEWYGSQLDTHDLHYLQALSLFRTPVSGEDVGAIVNGIFTSRMPVPRAERCRLNRFSPRKIPPSLPTRRPRRDGAALEPASCRTRVLL